MKNAAILFTAVLTFSIANGQSFAIDSMKRLLRAIPTHDSNTVRLSLKLSQEWSKYNTDSAIHYAQKSYQMAENIKFTLGVAESRALLAQLYLSKGDPTQAHNYYRQALHKYEQLNEPVGMGTVYHGLGCAMVLQDNYVKSHQYFTQALAKFEEAKVELPKSATYLKLGEIYLRTNQTEKAMDSYMKGVQIAEGSGNRKMIIEALNTVGLIYLKQEQHRKALQAFTRVKQLALIEGILPAIGEAQLNLANTYRELGQYDSAQGYYSQSLIYFNQAKNTGKIAAAYKGIARLQAKQHQFDKARQAIKESNAMAYAANNKQIVYDNIHLLMTMAQLEGDYKQSSSYFSKLLLLKDSMFATQMISSLEKIRTTYEIEKKQEKIVELQEDNNEKTRTVTSLFIAVTIAAISTIALAYSLVLVRRSSLTLQEQKKTLEEQKKRLEEQKKELEDLNRVKDKYFSVLSHDLRSPMANILGLLNLITDDGILTEQEKKQFFNRLKLSTSSALETMDNMLAWGKNQITENKNEIQDVNVQEVAERVCRFLSQIAENKSIRIVNQISPLLNLKADKNRLEFVLRNLMSNALKFSHKNGKIELWSSSTDAYINIHVKDFGTGLKQEVKEKLFMPAAVESTKGTAGEIGSGLGLVLCKEFIASHNGTISVESEEGKGTEFKITLPA